MRDLISAVIMATLNKSPPLQENVMPFKSQAQRRKFAQLLVAGKISDETFEEWNRETGSKTLPERLGAKSKRAVTSTARRRTAKRGDVRGHDRDRGLRSSASRS